LITVAVDCMGGDHGPHVTVPAALEFQARLPDVEVVLVGLREAIEAHFPGNNPRVRVHAASEVVAMDEPPAQALRSKKDSSMSVAIDLVKSGAAHACVSAGNTGAMVAGGMFLRRFLKNVRRPGIAAIMPTLRGPCVLLDVGANPYPKSE